MTNTPFRLKKRVVDRYELQCPVCKRGHYQRVACAQWMPVSVARYTVLTFTEESERDSLRDIHTYYSMVSQELKELAPC